MPTPTKWHRKTRRLRMHLLLPSGTDQSKAPASTAFARAKGFLMRKKELSMRPILHRNIPDARLWAQTHNIPWVQVRSDAFPIGPFPHLLQNYRASDAGSHCDDKGWQRQTEKPNAANGSWRCSSHNFTLFFSAA